MRKETLRYGGGRCFDFVARQDTANLMRLAYV